MTAVDELDALVAWLRGRLAHGLEALRDLQRGAPRTTIDALLAAPPSAAIGAPPSTAAIDAMSARLGLHPDERAVIAVLLAAALEPGLGAAVGLLFDPRGLDQLTLPALHRLLGFSRLRRFTPEDALWRWRLVIERGDAVDLDPSIVARLVGSPGRDPELVAHVQPIAMRSALPGWPIDGVAADVRRAVAAGASGVRLWCRGADGSGRRTLFAAVARALELVAVEARVIDPIAVRAAVRLARLDDLALAWSAAVTPPSDLPPPVLQAWFGAEPPPALPGVVELTVAVPALPASERRHAWTAIVPAFARWSTDDQRLVIERWAARPRQLVTVALAGADTAAEACALLHRDAIQRLEGHCDLLETPFTWDDLVLPDALLRSLRELAFEARALPLAWSEPAVARLFPQGRAVAALLCGPPGTGKTMAAQVLARELGLPLFRIDLSRLVSKYVGETSQNLARVLAAARDTDAVVLFDEADALFGKRTEIKDAHDRYANTETDYLLQAIEAWRGIAILATNKRQNIDPAFMRRMRMILEFPHRDAAERLRLWARLAATLTPDAHRLDATLARVAAIVEFTGAQIKAALLTARLVAAQGGVAVDGEHLLRGIDRELSKDGRSLTARDRSALLGP